MNSSTLEARYSSRDVTRIAGITYRQLDYWSRLGVLHWDGIEGSEPNPSGDEGTTTGTGFPRRYSATEVRVAYAIRLAGAAPKGQLAIDIADHVRARGLAGQLDDGWWRLDFDRMPAPDLRPEQ